MVRGGRLPSPEAIVSRSGGIGTVLAKDVLACLKRVIATTLRRFERVVVWATTDDRKRSLGAGGGGDRFLGRTSEKQMVATAIQKTVSRRRV